MSQLETNHNLRQKELNDLKYVITYGYYGKSHIIDELPIRINKIDDCVYFLDIAKTKRQTKELKDNSTRYYIKSFIEDIRRLTNNDTYIIKLYTNSGSYSLEHKTKSGSSFTYDQFSKKNLNEFLQTLYAFIEGLKLMKSLKEENN